MITGKDIYDVLAAIVPLYVAMVLAYGSVRWWKIFTPEQCAGINRFVAVFAVPLLGFHFISSNDPYAMNYRFLAADSLQKVVILSALFLWQAFSGRITLDWVITLFSLSTLPNTLVMGIPLLRAMYGDFSASLMVQIVVFQSVIWYTLMLFLFEFRGARALISEQFPDSAASITSFKVDSDVVSLNGREPLETEAEVGCDGKLHVVVRRSTSSVSMVSSSYNHNKSHGFNSMTSITPRASNLTGVEIYSLQSSREPTPRASSFNQSDFYAMFSSKVPSPRNAGDVYSLQSSKGPTPRTSNFDDEGMRYGKHHKAWRRSMSNDFVNGGGGAASYPTPNQMLATTGSLGVMKDGGVAAAGGPSKELHMFVWSSSASPVSEGKVRHPVNGPAGSNDFSAIDNASKILHHDMGIPRTSGGSKGGANIGELEIEEGHGSPDHKKLPSSTSKGDHVGGKNGDGNISGGSHQMPPASVMTRLILIMVWRKLIRNPNTYSSLIGVVWSLICYRWNIQMPTIVKGSISILSDAGLGMAMFSLGLFMALQPKIIACGRSVAAFSMAVRFLTGPAVIAATSIAIGVRGVFLHVAIVQAALPQGIVPFVFAKEYNCHPDILSTAVIFGMLIALPITILYYVLLGL